jgi:hypothetical protein
LFYIGRLLSDFSAIEKSLAVLFSFLIYKQMLLFALDAHNHQPKHQNVIAG